MAARFTLLDEPYYRAMLLVASALDEHRLPFCLVGGGAVQAWVATLRTEHGQRRLSEESILQVALRQTRDLDFSTRADTGTMINLLNELAASFGSGAHVLGARALRLGRVSVSFTIDPTDLSGMSELYDRFLESRHMVRLRRGAEPDEIPVIGIEELLVTKVTRRGDKSKDIVDVTELLAALREAGERVDLRQAFQLLEDRADAIGLLEEIARIERDDS